MPCSRRSAAPRLRALYIRSGLDDYADAIPRTVVELGCHVSGGIVQLVTKSGGTKFFGTVGGYFNSRWMQDTYQNADDPKFAVTNLVGSVSDVNLDFWSLRLAPLGSNSFTELAAGATSVANGFLAQLDPGEDDPDRDALYDLGVIATAMQLLKLPDGTVRVLVEGVKRARLVNLVDRDGYMAAEIVSRLERCVRALERWASALRIEPSGLPPRREEDVLRELLRGLAGSQESQPHRVDGAAEPFFSKTVCATPAATTSS